MVHIFSVLPIGPNSSCRGPDGFCTFLVANGVVVMGSVLILMASAADLMGSALVLVDNEVGLPWPSDGVNQVYAAVLIAFAFVLVAYTLI